MFDGSSQMLIGALVRSKEGRMGRIQNVSLPRIRIAWDKTESLTAESMSYLRNSSEVNESFQIHTLDRGWLPMNKVVTKTRARVESILSDLDEVKLDESQKKGRCTCPQNEEEELEDDTVSEDDETDEMDETVDVELVYPTGKVEEHTLTGEEEIRDFFAQVEEDFGDQAEIHFYKTDVDIIQSALGESWTVDSADALTEAKKPKRGRPLAKHRAKSSKKKASAASRYPYKNDPSRAKHDWDCTTKSKYKYRCKKLKNPGKGEIRKVETTKAAKAQYNKNYRGG